MGFLTFFNSKKEQTDTESSSQHALQTYANEHQLPFLKSIPIFHRQNKEQIVSLLFDPHRGIYLFDRVGWKIDQIKNATAHRATPDKRDKADVKVDSIHDFIRRKFNEVLHTDGCELINFLIFDAISKEAFETLDPSFHALMPQERLIFSDDTQDEIKEKLLNALEFLTTPLEASTLLGALFFHLNILPDNLHKNSALLTKDQQNFINHDLENLTTLSGNYGSGKTSLILLKSIYELLLHPEYKIIIVMPTLAVCDLLKKQLLDIIEYAIIDIDLVSIQVLTPQQVVSQHYQKLYKNESFSFAKITPKMFHHQYQSSDLIFCDDSYLMEDEFIRYLMKQQAKKKLCLVTREANGKKNNFVLSNSFRSPHAFLDVCSHLHTAQHSTDTNLHLLEGNPYMQIMLILQNLLKDIEHSQLLIAVPHSQFALKLLDEINNFYGTIAHIYKADEGLLNQDFAQILIATHNELSHLQREHVVAVKDQHTDEKYFCHAVGRASKSLYVIASDLEDDNNE
jgi:hypothetical protein